ncbi:hypothetical protein [Mucilaginibacter gynuensis]
MKKVCLYILFILVIADNASLGQLIKLPVLFEHYAEHQQLNGNISVMKFLSMHYWGQDLPDNDDDRDNQLPFKKASMHIHFYFFTPAKQFHVVNAPSFRKITYGLPQTADLPETCVGSLFKPPRLHFTV